MLCLRRVWPLQVAAEGMEVRLERLKKMWAAAHVLGVALG